MKKIMLFASALAGLFLAASCQQENLEPVQMSNTVTFTVEAPGALATKGTTINAGATIADGTNVNEVHYAVYKTNSGEDYSIDNSGEIDGPLVQGIVPMSNLTATIGFDLVQDQEYTAIFWAQVKDAGHYTLGDLRTISVATSVAGNDETRAAFYARYDFETYNNKDHKVTLRRPFAQLNLLTTQESLTPVQTNQTFGHEIDVKTSEVTVKGLATTFNTLTGLAPEGVEDICFVMADTPEEQGQETLVVNGKAYHYVAMNYFFVPQDEKLVDIEYTIITDKGTMEHEIVAVPVKENHRTNVIGNLLTKESTFEIIVEADFAGENNYQLLPDGVKGVANAVQLMSAITESGTIYFLDNIAMDSRLDIQPGIDIQIDMKGKKLTSSADYAFIVRDNASLVIDGNGTVEMPATGTMFYPAGNLVIENGTFVRNIPEGFTGELGSMFTGTKPAGGWEAAGVTINGGYFDNGYYNANAADIEELLAGTKTLVETADDIKKRGVSGDKNIVRVALKENVMKSLNRSNNYFHVYGGTFVGVNPAWGDEGCMLPTSPNYLRPWSYYQGALLDGQTFNADGLVLPEGYAITNGTHEDGRPTYTVTYSK